MPKIRWKTTKFWVIQRKTNAKETLRKCLQAAFIKERSEEVSIDKRYYKQSSRHLEHRNIRKKLDIITRKEGSSWKFSQNNKEKIRKRNRIALREDKHLKEVELKPAYKIPVKKERKVVGVNFSNNLIQEKLFEDDA